MPAGAQTFAADTSIVMDVDTPVFRIIGSTRIIGSVEGNPNGGGGSSGVIVDDGFLAGTPYCQVFFEGTINNGQGTSAIPNGPTISFSGNTLTYVRVWGDHTFVYGVA